MKAAIGDHQPPLRCLSCADGRVARNDGCSCRNQTPCKSPNAGVGPQNTVKHLARGKRLRSQGDWLREPVQFPSLERVIAELRVDENEKRGLAEVENNIKHEEQKRAEVPLADGEKQDGHLAQETESPEEHH